MKRNILTLLALLLTTTFTLAGEGGKQIRFTAGSDYGTVSGTVLRGEVADYTLSAAKGQRMTIALSSVEDNAVFHLYGPGGLLAGELKAWSGILPANHSYRLRVSSSRGNATYRALVHIR